MKHHLKITISGMILSCIIVSSSAFSEIRELEQRFNEKLLKGLEEISFSKSASQVLPNTDQNISNFAGSLKRAVIEETKQRDLIYYGIPIPNIFSEHVEKKMFYTLNQPSPSMTCSEVKSLFEEGSSIWLDLVEVIEDAANLDPDTMSDDEYLRRMEQFEEVIDSLLTEYDGLEMHRIEDDIVLQVYRAGIKELVQPNPNDHVGSRIVDEFRYVLDYELESFFWQGLSQGNDGSRVSLPPGIDLSIERNYIKLERKTSRIGACLSEKNLALELNLRVKSEVTVIADAPHVCRPVWFTTPINEPELLDRENTIDFDRRSTWVADIADSNPNTEGLFRSDRPFPITPFPRPLPDPQPLPFPFPEPEPKPWPSPFPNPVPSPRPVPPFPLPEPPDLPPSNGCGSVVTHSFDYTSRFSIYANFED